MTYFNIEIADTTLFASPLMSEELAPFGKTLFDVTHVTVDDDRQMEGSNGKLWMAGSVYAIGLRDGMVIDLYNPCDYNLKSDTLVAQKELDSFEKLDEAIEDLRVNMLSIADTDLQIEDDSPYLGK